ncbi:HAD family hydrolase [Corynebacterium bovis]|uniref:HAD superfamily hydrolase (TIGR01490 family) n=1 Tax=Corynebacterium bovis DSM 20582 = CIP 54.80 TaxID=927655 RepID=A0A8H9YBF4_9CORY|nr:HAD family hydrolase [Corynebacterium bovis]MBB3116212.1 HAD superfamily hydrolase (TIGR01490 family) [Corynebacterium bovis DSM 20582 = CIP 54.80]QQC47124.1 HAD family hydrolase [Corynebacterium bovis]WJY76796.1 Phosphoserine phosphatase [Corynebacterium bovis DSM 20582 = CIP 54.80]
MTETTPAGPVPPSPTAGPADRAEPATTADPAPEPATTADPAPRVLAVFDLDKTVIDTSASMAYRRPLADRGLITTGEVVRMMVMLGNYMLTTHSDGDMDATRDTLTAMIRGRDAATLREVAREAMHDVIVPYIYSEARDLIRWHREQGHAVAIITASARDLVVPVADELGVDHLLATELEVDDDGLFTGEVLFFCRGRAKVDGLRALADRHGYDLDASWAYTDSATDLPLLEAVGHPHAVNPDRPLRKEATARGWPVEEFSRPEPLFSLTDRQSVIAGASASLAVLGVVATGLALWFRGREQDPGSDTAGH